MNETKPSEKTGLICTGHSPDATHSRRRFLRNALLGTIAASVAGEPAVLLALQRETHVEAFLIMARRAELTRETVQKLHRVTDLILSQVRSDKSARAAFEQIKNWLLKQKISSSLAKQVGILGVSEDLGAAAGTSLLRALTELHTKTPEDVVKAWLGNPVRKFDFAEIDFVDRLIAETKRARDRYPAFAKKVDAATEELKEIASNLKNVAQFELPWNTELRTSPRVRSSHHEVVSTKTQQARCDPDSICEWCTSSAFHLGVCVVLVVTVIIIGGKASEQDRA